MLSKLQFLFFPTEANNQKAKALHSSSLIIFLFLIVIFQSGLSLFTYLKPGVLGFATNIHPETLLEHTNMQREEYGLKPLVLNQQLIEAAREKATAMFTFNCWAHRCNGKNPWWFFQNAGYDYLYAGENLARDFGDSQSVVEAWMNSPTHRDNILNSKYEEIGFGVVDGILDDEETTLVVQLFGRRQQKAELAEGEATSVKELAPAIMTSIIEEPRPKPVLSSFALSKDFYLGLVSLLIIIMAVDAVLLYQRRTVRISGKSFIHLSFFIIILISILLSYPGQIL